MSGGNWHLPSGSTATGPWSVSVGPDREGWAHTSLRVVELAPGGSQRFETGAQEIVVLPLSGGARVLADGAEIRLTGRGSVFDRVSDFAYVPRDSTVEIHSRSGGRFAVAGAVCERRLPARYGAAEAVPVELRGAGAASRQVNNFCTPESFDADRLIAVEVLTPGGNWSSYPPHKHDEHRPGAESELEEIYYFELSRFFGPAYMRVYGSGMRPIDLLAEVGDGDVVLVPHGWHGPAVVAPGVDLYYLNVMAGPHAERAWRICDDPVHAGVRAQWTGRPVDPRLPMTSAAGPAR
ncbi:MAG TPA: 5-deoxy-glucuronate isomerase [Sporichthyaceae bacterium]|jgi:5-deoxy-glucuronate isomerase|nr:5-deoxy-glucuronate isomerase [Sporichthyaceae bacterium]